MMDFIQMPAKQCRLIHDRVLNSRAVKSALAESHSSVSQARRMVERMLGVQRAWLMYIVGGIIRFFFPLIFPMGMHMDEASERNLRAAIAQTGLMDSSTSGPRRPVVLLPTHRSHIDYIALFLIIQELKLPIPLVVAGDNLNMPMFGSILHAGGALFIRRSFAGDKVYSSVFNETMTALLEQNQVLGCFIEGGRSRSGKLLTPKPGFLKSVVDSVLDGRVEDALIVPIAFSYGRVVEARSMVEEMSGGAKKKEAFGSSLRSMIQLIRTTFWGSACYGSVEISVAPSFSAKDHLKRKEEIVTQPVSPVGFDLDAVQQPGAATYRLKSSDRKLSIVLDSDHEKKTRVQLALSLGFRTLHECNRVGVIQGTALVGTVLLMHKDRGLKISDLVDKVEWLRSEIVARGGQVQAMKSVQDTVAEVVDKIMWGSGRARLVKKHKSVVMTGLFTPMETLELSTFRNNLIHFFIQDGIVAVALHAALMRTPAEDHVTSPESRRHRKSPEDAEVPLMDVQQGAQFLSVLLKHEFIYKPVVAAGNDSHASTFTDNFVSITSYMAERNVLNLKRNGDGGDSVRVDHKNRQLWEFLSGLMFPFIDSYYLCLLGCFVLIDEELELTNLVSRIQEIGENLYMNNLMDFYDAVAKDTLMNAVTAFADIGLLQIETPTGSRAKMVKSKVPKSALLETIELLHSFRKGKGKHGEFPHRIADAIDLAQALTTNS
jgi:hypothetical protein